MESVSTFVKEVMFVAIWIIINFQFMLISTGWKSCCASGGVTDLFASKVIDCGRLEHKRWYFASILFITTSRLVLSWWNICTTLQTLNICIIFESIHVFWLHLWKSFLSIFQEIFVHKAITRQLLWLWNFFDLHRRITSMWLRFGGETLRKIFEIFLFTHRQLHLYCYLRSRALFQLRDFRLDSYCSSGLHIAQEWGRSWTLSENRRFWHSRDLGFLPFISKTKIGSLLKSRHFDFANIEHGRVLTQNCSGDRRQFCALDAPLEEPVLNLECWLKKWLVCKN